MRDGCIHRLDFGKVTFEVLKKLMTTLQHKHMRQLYAYVASDSPFCEVILQYVMTSLYACHLIGYGQDVT